MKLIYICLKIFPANSFPFAWRKRIIQYQPRFSALAIKCCDLMSYALMKKYKSFIITIVMKKLPGISNEFPSPIVKKAFRHSLIMFN